MQRRLFHTTATALAVTLGYAATPACVVDVQDGIEVELTVAGVASSGVAFDSAHLHIASVALLPCEEASGFELRPSVARAHHVADGSIGTPHVVTLFESGVPVGASLGAMRPPPGRYCAIELALVPATPDADGFVEALRDWTLLARARIDGREVEARGYANRLIRVPLSTADGSDCALELDATSTSAEVSLTIDLAAAFARSSANATPEELGTDILLGLQSGLRARCE